jgi:hypothetical protein
MRKERPRRPFNSHDPGLNESNLTLAALSEQSNNREHQTVRCFAERIAQPLRVGRPLGSLPR